MCTADGLVVFLAVRPRAPFVPTVWLLPFQHAPPLAPGSHLTCKGTEPSEELRRPGRGREGCSPAQLRAARQHCQPSQDVPGEKPCADICPALVKGPEASAQSGLLVFAARPGETPLRERAMQNEMYFSLSERSLQAQNVSNCTSKPDSFGY